MNVQVLPEDLKESPHHNYGKIIFKRSHKRDLKILVVSLFPPDVLCKNLGGGGGGGGVNWEAWPPWLH